MTAPNLQTGTRGLRIEDANSVRVESVAFPLGSRGYVSVPTINIEWPDGAVTRWPAGAPAVCYHDLADLGRTHCSHITELAELRS